MVYVLGINMHIRKEYFSRFNFVVFGVFCVLFDYFLWRFCCLLVCVCACVRACVCACVRACERACVRACVCVCLL